MSTILSSSRTSVRCWNIDDGTLQWENIFPNGIYTDLPGKVIISSIANSVTVFYQGKQQIYTLHNGDKQSLSYSTTSSSSIIPIMGSYSINFGESNSKSILYTVTVTNSITTSSVDIYNNQNSKNQVLSLSTAVTTKSIQFITLQGSVYVLGISQDSRSIVISTTGSSGRWYAKNDDTIVSLTMIPDTNMNSNEISKNTYLRIDSHQHKVYFIRIGLSDNSDPITDCNNGQWVVYEGSSVNYPTREQKVVTGGLLTVPVDTTKNNDETVLSTTSLIIAESSIVSGVEFTVIDGQGTRHKSITVDQAVYQESGSETTSPYSILPVTSSMVPLSSYGIVTRVYPFQFTRPDNTLGMRIVLSFEDGTTVLFQSGKIVWKRMDGEACTVQVLPVDVHSETYSSTDNHEYSNEASITSDPALSFVNRLSHQFGYLQTKIVSFGISAISSLKNIANDPVGVITGRRTSKPSSTGAMNPGVPAPLSKLLILRSRIPQFGYAGVDTCTSLSSAGFTHTGIQGSLIALYAESGVSPWRIPLPVATEAHRYAKQGNIIQSSSFISRPSPIQMHSPEILVIESTLIKEGTTKVWLSWVNAETGLVASEASYTTSSTINQVLLSPVIHTASQRKVYTIVHHDDTAIITLGSHDVIQSLKALDSNYVLSYLIYDVHTYMEGITGKVMDFLSSSIPAVHALQTSIDKESSTKSEGGSGTIHKVDLVPVGLHTVWESQLSAPDTRSRILNIAAAQSINNHNILSSHIENKLTEEFINKAQHTGKTDNVLTSSTHATSLLAAKGVQVLPDDSLFIKYSNPHFLVVAVGPTGPSTSLFEKQRNIYIQERHRMVRTESLNLAYNSETAVQGNITIYVINTITGQSLYVRKHAGASGPVSLLVNDNWIINTFWNTRARRPELASASMYEGAIGTYDLAPWKLRTAQSLSPNISSYTSFIPVVRHRTFILPVTIKALTVTQTLYSITSPHLLFVTENDGIMIMDRRLFDPRRPTNEPTEHEKAEGLMQYNPYIPLRHNWIINHGLPTNRLQHVVSTPSSFESTTYIVGIGIDTFVSRIAPAKTFDQLDPDFNFILFIILLLGGGLLTFRLGQLTKAKDTKDAWK